MKAALLTLLRADAALSAVVADRLSWGGQPPAQRARPCATLTLASEPEVTTLDGPSGVRAALVQIDVWADVHDDAEAGMRAVRALLSGYRGQVDGVVFHGIFAEGARDLSEAGGRSVIYGLSADFRVVWSP